MEVQNKQSGWLVSTILLSVMLLLVCVLYQQTLWYLVELWNDLSEGEYAHGYLVLAISGYLIYTNRHRFEHHRPCAQALTLPLVLFSSLLWLAAVLVEIEVLQALALLALCFSIAWVITGHRAMLLLAFPIVYISFAIPVWFPVSPLLQDLTADVVFWITRLIDVPAFRQENMIIVPAGTLSIKEACSGLRYFLAALALGSLYAYLNYVTLAARIAVVAVVAGTAVLANIVRVFIVVYLGYKTDMQHPWVADHLMLGWYIFAGLIALLLFLDAKLYRRATTDVGADDGVIAEMFSPAHASCENTRSRTVLIVTLCGLSVTAGPAVLSITENQSRVDNTVAITLPSAVKDWAGPLPTQNNWAPIYHGAIEVKRDYSRDGVAGDSKRVSVYIGYYPYQSQGSELINVLNKITNPKQWKPVYTRAHFKQLPEQNVLEQKVESARKTRLIWYWYTVAGQKTTNKYEAKFLQLKSMFTLERGGYVVAVSTELNSDVQSARETLNNYISQMAQSLQPGIIKE